MMDSYLEVSNWKEFQHYKDRNPPWIKLHNSLLDNYDFEMLSDSAKGHLLCIWMLASRTNNKMPNDANWIRKKIGANSQVDLKTLIELNFLSVQGVEQDASNVLHNEKQDATEYVPSEEERREEERREEERREENNNCGADALIVGKPTTPQFEFIKDIYNEVLPMLPACKNLNDERKSKIRGIWRTELQNTESWKQYFEYVRDNCKWVLKPKNNGQQNSIDWFLRSKNLTRVREGIFDDKS